MSSQDDIERTHRIGDHAVAKIKSNELAAWPPNYEIWFTYAAGFNAELNKRINTILRENQRITQDDLDSIRSEFYGSETFEERVEAVGSQLSSKVSEIMAMIQDASGKNSDYNQSLEGASQDLNHASDSATVQAIASKLMELTQQVQEHNSMLTEKLVDSEKEIAGLKDTLESVRTEALADQLTGLGNRTRFDRSMNDALIRAQVEREPFSLLMCDIDHFKKFNDTHGHQTGDQVLRFVAATLKSCIKGQDIACRYGGEEFCIILPGTGIENAITVAENIRRAVMAKELVKRSTGENLGRVTISIGVAEWNRSDDVSSIIDRADMFLYAAKGAGRNKVMASTEEIDGTDVAGAA